MKKHAKKTKTSRKGVKKSSSRRTAKTSKSKVSLFQDPTQIVEYKNNDINGTLTVNSLTGVWSAVLLINGIAQGTGAFQRVGRRYKNTSMQYRMTQVVQANNTLPQILRVLVVWDKNPNGASPTVTNILELDNFRSPMALANSDRFVVISDEIFSTNEDGGNGTIHGEKYKKMALESNAPGSAATIASINQGAMYLMACAPILGGTGAGPQTVDIFTRVRFTDI